MNSDTPLPASPPPQAPNRTDAPPAADAGPVLDSAALLQGKRQAAIVHNGEIYRLQTTRQGKLILTK